MATAQELELIRAAMLDPDNYVLQIDYTDVKGQRTRRKISPIRFIGLDRLLVLCLSSGEPRQMKPSAINNLQISAAATVLVPDPKHVIH